MKITSALMKILVFHFAILFFSQNKLIAQSDPHRGLYIDDFALKISGSLHPAFSILGVGAKEDSVLLYCKENHITYITLYGLNQILDNDTVTSHNDSLLMNFIIKARRYYGITEVGGAIGSKNAVYRIDTIYQRLAQPTAAYTFSHDEKFSGYNTRLKFVENPYLPGERLFAASEFTKDFLKLSAYNRALPVARDSGKFDVINMEFEFWNSNTLASFPENYTLDSLYLVEAAQKIMPAMAHVRNMNNSLATNRKLKTEIYLGYLDKGTITPAVKAAFIDGLDTIGSSRRLMDRILLHYYNIDPDDSYNRTNYLPRYQNFRANTTLDSTLIHPLLSGASTYLGYGENHYGTWFDYSNRNNIFTAEKEWYEDAQVDSTTGGTHKNRYEYGGAQWYTRDVLVNKRGTPTLINHTNTFYTNSPVNTNGAASGSVDFTYSGPIEAGTNGLLRIYDSLGTTKIDSALFTVSSFNGSTYLIKNKTLNVGNYLATLKLTYVNGYSYTYKERVIVKGTPSIYAMGETTFCDGGSVILKSSRTKFKTGISGNGLSYHWYRNGTLLSSNYDTTAPYYNAILAGYYKCRIDTNASVTNIFTDSILVTILANAPVSIAQVSYGGPSYTLTANGTHSGTTSYNWDNGQTTRSINIHNYDSYRVIVTQVNGCRREAQVNIKSYCSSKNFDFVLRSNNDTLVSNFGVTTYSPGDSLLLQNNLHINQNVTFNGAYVQCEPGVKITVDSSKTLTITNASHFLACSNMWRGIEVKKGGRLVIDSSSVIEGAQRAVNLLEGSNYRLSKCTFNKNYVGVQINGFTHAPISGTEPYNKLKFDCSKTSGAQDTLPSPYPGQMPPSGIKGFAGIQIEDTYLDLFYLGLDSINFKNLSNGVFCNDAFLRIEKCLFRNIIADTLYDSLVLVNGAGVNIQNPNVGSAQIKGFGSTASKENFTNCEIGINVADGPATIWGNKCSKVKEAVRITTNNNDVYTIYNNYFNVDHIGINMLHCDDAGIISIVRDTINVGDASINATGNVGINVVMMGNTTSDSSVNISANVINSHGAAAGISCNTLRKGQMIDNHINILRTGNSIVCSGILMDNCYETKALDNTINGSDTTDVLQMGISLAQSDNCKLYCNYTNDTYDGIFATNSCVNSDVRSNTMHNHFNGLHLSSSADIYPQYWRGNRWTGTYSYKGALNDNTNGSQIINSQFKVNTSDSSSILNFMPVPIYPSSGWFFIDNTTTNYRCRYFTRGGGGGFGEEEDPEEEGRLMNTINPGIPEMSVIDSSLTETISLVDSMAAEGDLSFSEFHVERNYIIDQGLYRKLGQHPEMLEVQLFEDFYSTNENSIIGAFENISQLRQNMIGNPSTLQLQVNGLQAQLKQKVKELSVANEDSISNLVIQVKNLKDLIGSYQTDLRNQKNVELDNLISANSALSTTTNIQEYEKTVNDIYMTTVAKGIYTFTSAQKEHLNYIASLCPLEGGKAVYAARSIYAFINSYQNYDDKNICGPFEPEEKIKVKSEKDIKPANINFIVSPNPASDNLLLTYNTNEVDKLSFVLFNNLSEKVLDKIIDSKIIDLSRINNGIYHYIIFVNGLMTKSGKLVVIK
ncbi:MAG: hypothetical protein IPO70_11050 [Bacteroidetes bacterium]|nr:hypothetical protein [Bacteroidota bacterium]